MKSVLRVGVSQGTHQPTARQLALLVYKRMLRSASSVEPASRRPEIVHEIRDGFRANRDETDPEKVDQMLAQAYSKATFIDMMVPPQTRAALGKNKGIGGTYVIKEGELKEGTGQRLGKRGYLDNHTLDPEDLRRHEYLLRRQQFMEPPPAHVMEQYNRWARGDK